MVSVETKTCPRCAEEVKAQAQVCRFCGHEFGDGSPLRGVQPPPTETRTPDRLFLPLSVAAWALSVIPLTVVLREGGGVEDTIVSFVAAVGFSIGLAAVIRGPYAYVRKRPFGSPWLFVVACALALLAFAGTFVEEENGGATSAPTVTALGASAD